MERDNADDFLSMLSPDDPIRKLVAALGEPYRRICKNAELEDDSEESEPYGTEKAPQKLVDVIRNRDKYQNNESQQRGFDEYCQKNKAEASVDKFLKWLDAPWMSANDISTKDNGIGIGDYVSVSDAEAFYIFGRCRDDAVFVVEKVAFDANDNGELYATVRQVYPNEPIVREQAKHGTVRVKALSKLVKRSWTKDECIKAIGKVVKSISDGESAVELIYRVRIGKDGKTYVNGITASELAANYVDYKTGEPCCAFEKK